VIVRGRTLLLLGQEIIERGLLRGGGMEDQSHSMYGLAAVRAAEIKTSLGQSVDIAFERNELAGIDWAGNAVGLGGKAQGCG
jgi:hypothetical protein